MTASKRQRARGKDIRLPQHWPWWISIGEALQAAVTLPKSHPLVLELEKAGAFKAGRGAEYAVVKRAAPDLRGLGEALQAMCEGCDAREVFEQQPGEFGYVTTTGKDGSKTKQPRRGVGRPLRNVEMQRRVLNYWQLRGNGKSPQEAAEEARNLSGCHTPAPAIKTLLKYAGRWMEPALRVIEQTSYVRQSDGTVNVTRSGPDMSALRASAKKRSKRP